MLGVNDGTALGTSDGTVDGIKLGTTDGVVDGSRLGAELGMILISVGYLHTHIHPVINQLFDKIVCCAATQSNTCLSLY